MSSWWVRSHAKRFDWFYRKLARQQARIRRIDDDTLLMARHRYTRSQLARQAGADIGRRIGE